MTNLSNDDLADLLGLDFDPLPVSDEAVEVTYRRLDDARATGAPFVFQVDRNTFRAYETAAGAAAGLARFVEAEREVFENVDGERPVRAFIDCDAKPDASDADLKRVGDAFTKEAVALGVPNDKARPLTLMNDRPGKRSRHFLANGWGFADWRGLKRFEDGMRRRVGAAGLPGGLTAATAWQDDASPSEPPASRSSTATAAPYPTASSNPTPTTGTTTRGTPRARASTPGSSRARSH